MCVTLQGYESMFVCFFRTTVQVSMYIIIVTGYLNPIIRRRIRLGIPYMRSALSLQLDEGEWRVADGICAVRVTDRWTRRFGPLGGPLSRLNKTSLISTFSLFALLSELSVLAPLSPPVSSIGCLTWGLILSKGPYLPPWPRDASPPPPALRGAVQSRVGRPHHFGGFFFFFF